MSYEVEGRLAGGCAGWDAGGGGCWVACVEVSQSARPGCDGGPHPALTHPSVLSGLIEQLLRLLLRTRMRSWSIFWRRASTVRLRPKSAILTTYLPSTLGVLAGVFAVAVAGG